MPKRWQQIRGNPAAGVRPLDVKVLHTEGCPATPKTIDLIRDVAANTGTPIRMESILVESPEQALELQFLGSPTVQVNGLDIDPTARSDTAYGFTWRHYGASGMPSRDMIAKALAEAAGETDPK